MTKFSTVPDGAIVTEVDMTHLVPPATGDWHILGVETTAVFDGLLMRGIDLPTVELSVASSLLDPIAPATAIKYHSSGDGVLVYHTKADAESVAEFLSRSWNVKITVTWVPNGPEWLPADASKEG